MYHKLYGKLDDGVPSIFIELEPERIPGKNSRKEFYYHITSPLRSILLLTPMPTCGPSKTSLSGVGSFKYDHHACRLKSVQFP